MSELRSSPEQLERSGMAAFHSGDWAQAATAFERLRQLHLEQGLGVEAAEAANNLAVALLKSGRPEQALLAAEGTPATFAAAGRSLLAAQAEGNLASALEACGRAAEAQQAYLRAVGLFEEAGEIEGRALCLQSISRLQLRSGSPLEALASMQAGLEGTPNRSLGKRLLSRLLRIPGRILGR